MEQNTQQQPVTKEVVENIEKSVKDLEFKKMILESCIKDYELLVKQTKAYADFMRKELEKDAPKQSN